MLTLKDPGDITIASLHWGSNWGYDVPSSHVRFARRLIDAGVHLVHGHSSHHPRPIEVHRGKLILYGCGDAVNDYEGIKGFEAYRNDLRLLYFASIEPGSGQLTTLHMTPRSDRMRLEHASHQDAEWLRSTLQHISRRFQRASSSTATPTSPCARPDEPRSWPCRCSSPAGPSVAAPYHPTSRTGGMDMVGLSRQLTCTDSLSASTATCSSVPGSSKR